MKFTRDQVAPVTIREVERGSIRVGDERVTHSVVLTQEKMVVDWVPPDTESLSLEHVERLIRFEPEIVIVGSGWAQRRPPNEFVFALARQGIGLEVMDTGAACRTFNILLAEGRRIVAFLTLD